MNIIVLSLLFMYYTGYPVGCKGNEIKFQYGNSNYSHKEGDTCYTKDGEGTCMAMHKCSEINELIKSRGGIHTKGTADIVTNRICGFKSKDARVCCLPEKILNNPILPTHDDCGFTSTSRINGGENFPHGAHPWLVGVGFMQDIKSIKVECGGTLITKRHVLSAAHCFDPTHRGKIPQLTHVILGEHSLSKETEREPPIILKIADRRNPGYDITRYYKDIELLTLERDVEFGDYIRPACLPFKHYERNFNFSKHMTIAGWGRTAFTDIQGTDKPLQAKVPVVPLKECKSFYEIFENVMLDETQICLGRNGKDACRGDSGGPVIYRDTANTSRYFVIGITAFGAECRDFNFPGVYTYVPAYLNWILNNL